LTVEKVRRTQRQLNVGIAVRREARSVRSAGYQSRTSQPRIEN
jgi:hypothetical protein